MTNIRYALSKFHELNLIFIHRCDADQDILGASSANVRHLQSKTSTGRGVEPKCVCVMHHFNSKKYTIYGKT